MADYDNGDGGGFDPEQNQLGIDPTQLAHPLSGWADQSNLAPEDIAQHIHDPEGFKDAMVAKGVPPPGMDLEHAGDGTFRPVQAYQTPTPSTGVEPPSTKGPPGPDYSARTDNLPSWTQQPYTPPAGQIPTGTAAMQQAEQGAFAPSAQGPFPPPPPAGLPAQRPFYDPWNRPEQRPGGAAPAAQPRPQDTTTPSGARPTSGGPMDITPKPAGIEAAQQKQKEQQDKRNQALTDFGKMMQGIKMPQRPPPPNVGTPSVKAHTSLASPQALSLLSLLGQPGSQQSSAMPNILARLLGRVG